MLGKKGLYIWLLEKCAPDAQTLVERVKSAGLDHLVIKIADGDSDFPGTPAGEALLRTSINALKAAGITVWGWAVPYGADSRPDHQLTVEAQAARFATRLRDLALPGAVIDAENWKFSHWTPELATAYMNALRGQIGALGIPNTVIALSTYRFPSLHGSFPIVEFMAGCDVSMPQIYWIGGDPVSQLERSFQEWKPFCNGKPFYATGIAAPADTGDWKPTPKQITDFLQQAETLGIPTVNFWSMQHALADQAIWNAIAAYQPGEPHDSPPVQVAVTPFVTEGTVTENQVNYRSEPTVVGNVPVAQLNKGDAVEIVATAHTNGDPANWYQIKIADQTYWVAARYVQLKASATLLPVAEAVVAAAVVAAPAAGNGANGAAAINPPVVSSDPVPAATSAYLSVYMTDYGIKLRETWNSADLQTAAALLTKLAAYNVVLSSANGLGWNLSEMQMIEQAIDLDAAHAVKYFREELQDNTLTPEFAFRVLYAPLRILRDGRDNVSPVANSVWWASNMDGYSIRYGNLVFTRRGGPVTIGQLKRSKFEPVEKLIIHEISHVINWRYTLELKGKWVEPSVFYGGSGQQLLPAAFSATGHDENLNCTPSDGLTTQPRSSNDPWETVTDLIVNDVVNGFSINTPGRELFTAAQDQFGRLRAYQAHMLMLGVVRHRVQTFAPSGDKVFAQSCPALLTLRDQYTAADTAQCQAANLQPIL